MNQVQCMQVDRIDHAVMHERVMHGHATHERVMNDHTTYERVMHDHATHEAVM